MKNKISTAVSVIMALIPWTILPLRACTSWAMDYAHIMIPCCAVFMILSGIYSILVFTAGKVRNTVMSICLVIHCLYGAFGIAVVLMMTAQKLI